MPLNSPEDLQSALHEDRTWRRIEISDLFSDVKKLTSTREVYASRAFWLLQYAHWEGFIKRSAEKYLDFVTRKRLQYKSVQPGFCLLPSGRFWKSIKNLYQDPIRSDSDLKIVINISNERFATRTNVINTKSNLTSKVLLEISTMCCIDLMQHVDETFLDTQLIDRRNKIAHGEWVSIDYSDVEILRDRVERWMDDCLDEFVLCAQEQKYLLS